MLDFSPLFKTMKSKKVSTYTLIKHHDFSSGTIYRLKDNRPVLSTTISDLCKCLDCSLDEVVRYVDDDIISADSDNIDNDNIISTDSADDYVLDIDSDIDLDTKLKVLKSNLQNELDFQKNEQEKILISYESKINQLLEKLDKNKLN